MLLNIFYFENGLLSAVLGLARRKVCHLKDRYFDMIHRTINIDSTLMCMFLFTFLYTAVFENHLSYIVLARYILKINALQVLYQVLPTSVVLGAVHHDQNFTNDSRKMV